MHIDDVKIDLLFIKQFSPSSTLKLFMTLALCSRHRTPPFTRQLRASRNRWKESFFQIDEAGKNQRKAITLPEIVWRKLFLWNNHRCLNRLMFTSLRKVSLQFLFMMKKVFPRRFSWGFISQKTAINVCNFYDFMAFRRDSTQIISSNTFC